MVSRFRVKKLSPRHPLPVFRESQLPDLTDAANVQRAVPQIETGVEKEEEEEHDLQAAISAAHAAVTTGSKIQRYIPTPDASRTIPEKEYRKNYNKRFKEPSALIRFSATVEDSIGCPYVMDEQDDAFLKQYNANRDSPLSEDDFEKVMWQFESTVNQHWPHLNLDTSQFPSFEAMRAEMPQQSDLSPYYESIYTHWKTRRLERQGKPIMPQLQYEDVLKGEIDPYVCFRRRETKPIRKTRRTDQQSLERLRKLRTEMEMARNLLEMVLRREKIRKEGLVVEHAVFDLKCKLREYQRQLGIKEDEDLLPLSKKKRKTSLEPGTSGATIKIPLNKLKRDDGRQEKSPIQLAIEAELARKQEQDAGYEDVTECPYQPFPLPLPKQFYQPLSQEHKRIRFRKRIGRGGRVLIDRVGFRHHHHPSDARGGGKTKPGALQEPIFDKYRFDSESSEDEEPVEVDEMDDKYMQHQIQLLSEADLRNLVTVPFASPASLSSPQSRTGNLNRPLLNGMASGSVNRQGLSALPMKRQNSRTKMTPQQAAVAMANGMIAANMAAMAAAQQHNSGLSPLRTSGSPSTS